MPTNQSSPWGGGKLRTSSNSNSPTATASSAKTVVVTKVPFSQTSPERASRKDQAKPLSSNVASSASPLRQTTVAPSVVSVWETEDENKTNTQSQFTAVPDGSPNLPQQLNVIKVPNQVLERGLTQAGYIPTETSAPSSIHKKEYQAGCKVQLKTSQPGNGLAVSIFPAGAGDRTLRLESLLSVCHQDLFIKGQPSVQQMNKLMVSIDVSQCGSHSSKL